MKHRVVIIIPAFNEAQVLPQVIKDIRRQAQSWRPQIVVVNDGSADATGEVARQAGATVVTHKLNRGLGAALGTGLAYAKQVGADIAVTLDADGQHDPADIRKVMASIIKRQADVVIGTRLNSNRGRMPLDRLMVNWLSNLLTWLLFGVWTSDSQSGFRAFSKQAIQSLRLKTERMEVSSEIFGEIHRHRLRLAEVPIRVIYTAYSRRKGQSSLNAAYVFFKLMLRLAR